MDIIEQEEESANRRGSRWQRLRKLGWLEQWLDATGISSRCGHRRLGEAWFALQLWRKERPASGLHALQNYILCQFHECDNACGR